MSREFYLFAVVCLIGLDMVVSWIAVKRTNKLTSEAIADAFAKGEIEDFPTNKTTTQGHKQMSMQILLSVAQNDAAQFGSLDLLNDELLNSTLIGELLEEYPDEPFIKQDSAGALTFFDREDGGTYAECVEVWRCFGIDEAEVIGAHLISGTLVLSLDIEGNDPKYIKITPNLAQVVKPKF